MSTEHTWRVNGMDLDDAGSLGWLMEGTMWRPPVGTRRRAVVVPGRHGTLSPTLPEFEEPIVRLTCRTLPTLTTHTTIAAAVDALTALVTQPAPTLTRISAGVTASARAELVSITSDDFSISLRAVTTVLFAIPGVFLSETATVGTDLAFSADLVSAEVSHLAGLTGPVGDAVVRITGPATNPAVTNPITGTGISWTGVVPAGQYLFMSAATLTARLSAASGDWLAGGTPVTATVSYPPAGGLQLWPTVSPTPTDRKALLSATATGKSAATKLAVRAGRWFL